MIRWFKRWLDLRKVLKPNKHYDEGYSYAAGILLKFKGTIKPSWDIFDADKDDFDRGILDAEREFENLMQRVQEND